MIPNVMIDRARHGFWVRQAAAGPAENGAGRVRSWAYFKAYVLTREASWAVA